MKRTLTFLLFFTLLLSCAACGKLTEVPETEAPDTEKKPAGETEQGGTESSPPVPAETGSEETASAAVTAAEPPAVYLLPEDAPHVLLDGTGKTDGAYQTLPDAVNALPDSGGIVIVCGNTATPTSEATRLSAKPLILTSQKGAVLTVGRALFFAGETVFTDLTVANGAAASLDFIYMQGNSLTVTSSVVCTPSESTGRYISLYTGGTRDSSVTADGQIFSLSGGIWRNIFLGNYSGTFGGTVSLFLDGADVAGGSVFLSNNNSGKSTASLTVRVSAGEISAIKQVNGSSTYSGHYDITLAGGSVKVTDLEPGEEDTFLLDLSAGRDVTLCGAFAFTEIRGGDATLKLTGPASASAWKASGTIRLAVMSDPMPSHDYLFIQSGAGSPSVIYQTTGTETLKTVNQSNGVGYQMDHLESTTVHIRYGNVDLNASKQPGITLIRGASTGGTTLTGYRTGKDADGAMYIEADLPKGLYCYKVYYPGRDFGIKYFYVDGSADRLDYEMLLAPLVANSYTEDAFSNTTDQVLEAFYDPAKITGYKSYETPAFTLHADDRSFSSNGEVCAFLENIAANNANAYIFYPIGLTVQYKLKTPVLVFTNDAIPAGATMEEIGSKVRAGGTREILMVTGGIHGNEPAGEEAVLAYALELTGDYGKDLLSRFGAVILIPSVSADNLRTFTRNYPDGCNANRDLLAMEHDGSRAIAAVYNAFLPTVTIACHEDIGVLELDMADDSVADIHNMAFYFTPGNTPLNPVNDIISGTYDMRNHIGLQMLQIVIDQMNGIGYRAQHYRYPNCSPVHERSYAAVRGSLSFLIETNGINNGKGNFGLRVNAHVSGIKAIVGEVIKNGHVAEMVKAAREAVAVREYDPDNKFILLLSEEKLGTDPFPSIYLNGTYKNKNAVKAWSFWSKVEKSRPMPTAYVLPKTTPKLAEILALLDLHGISYTELKAGSSLLLRRYRISGTSASLGNAENVTFSDGAYLISTDSPDAYLIAYLFEPDSYRATSGLKVSLFDMGLLTASDAFYRSEVSYIEDAVRDLKA